MSANFSQPRYFRPDEGKEPAAPATILLLVIIGVIFLIMYYQGHGSINDAVAYRWGEEVPAQINKGAWWLLFTPIFLHGSIPHVAMNGWSLYIMGTFIERFYGSRRLIIFFLLTGIAGNIVTDILMPNSLSLGASGAIFGLVGVGLIFPIRWKKLLNEAGRIALLKQLLFVTVLNIAFSYLPGIDLWAHFGGLACGAILGLLVVPEKIYEDEISPLRNAGVNLVATALIAATLAAAIIQARGNELTRTVKVVIGSAAVDFRLPYDWTKEKTDSIIGYLSPDQVAINIIPEKLTREDIATYITEKSLKGQFVHPMVVDGRPAALVQPAVQNAFQLMCVISVTKMQGCSIILTTSPQKKAKGIAQFNRILSTIHFEIH